MAAEITGCRACRPELLACFNEAAANGRGNRWRKILSARKPPCFNEAAANGRGNHATRVGLARERATGFNEAAANGRGNRSAARRRRPRCARFNEAAANGRGNLGRLFEHHLHRPASMRPRRMAAEILRLRTEEAMTFQLQ